MKKVTAKDVADYAGVSSATVSLVLRGKPGVSDAVRDKVLQAAQSLGYLSTTAKSGIIQLVVYKRHGKVISNSPFMELLIQGVTTQAAELGFHLSISYFYGDKNRAEQLKGICSLKSEGILLLATEMNESDMEPFLMLKVPVVMLDNFSVSMKCDAVVIDSRYGVRSAVEYLVQCGHTRIGYLHSNVEIRNFHERKHGYLTGCQLLSEQAAREATRRIVKVGLVTEHATASMREYLKSGAALPSAFFADNDHIAAGCCRALQEVGYRIPEDISVIGFDDAPICELVEPHLTTMAVPKERMGACAVSLLSERIRHPTSEIIRISIEPKLLIRGSVLDLRRM